MGKWYSFGNVNNKPKKTTAQLRKEIAKLEKKQKEEQERYDAEKRLNELQHAKRNAILGRAKSIAVKSVYYSGRAIESAGRGAYKTATSKQAKKLYKSFK